MDTPTISDLMSRCETGFSDLASATQVAFEKSCDLTTAKTNLETAKATLESAKNTILVKFAENPKDLGANEATRNATISSMTAREESLVAIADTGVRTAQGIANSAECDLTLAKIRLDGVKTLLRILELAKKD